MPAGTRANRVGAQGQNWMPLLLGGGRRDAGADGVGAGAPAFAERGAARGGTSGTAAGQL